jgi:hypothetical protein
LVNVGYPPVEPVNVTLMEVVDPSMADTFVIIGVSPTLFVVTDENVFELGEVHAVSDNALNKTE